MSTLRIYPRSLVLFWELSIGTCRFHTRDSMHIGLFLLALEQSFLFKSFMTWLCVTEVHSFLWWSYVFWTHLEELIKGLRMLGHCDKYTKIWATLTDHVKEVYFTFLTHLEQDCPVLWDSSLGLYYRRVSQVPSDCASFVAIPRNPFKRYKKACHPRNLDKPILPSVEDDYPLVPSLTIPF